MILAAASLALHALALAAAVIAGSLVHGDEDDPDMDRRCAMASIISVVLAFIGWAIR